MLSRTYVALAVLLSCLSGISVAAAQNYPTRAITIIVPFPPGGPTDQLARQLGPRLSAKLGQNVVVENVSGGATNIGTARVARAAPDGYTLLLHNLQMAANATLYPDQGFNTERDLTLVGLVNNNPLVLIGRKSLPPRNLTELIDWMKNNSAKIALPGIGTTGHLTTAVLLNTIGARADLIPYRGGAPALQDILGEQDDLYTPTPQQVVQMIKSNMVKAYAVTSKEPLPQLPDVPSLPAKLGPQLEVLYWQALFAPAGTPAPVLNKISAAVQDAMSDPQLLKEWAEQGVKPFPKDMATHDGGEKFYRSEITRWRDVIRKNKIDVMTH